MAQTDKIPKGGRNVQRGNRLRSHTATMRPHHIKNSRDRHLKNALQSCGAKFAENLRLYYARIGIMNAPRKHRVRNTE